MGSSFANEIVFTFGTLFMDWQKKKDSVIALNDDDLMLVSFNTPPSLADYRLKKQSL